MQPRTLRRHTPILRLDTLLPPRRLVLHRRPGYDHRGHGPLRGVVSARTARARVSAATPTASGGLQPGSLCWVAHRRVGAILLPGCIALYCGFGDAHGGCGEM